MTVQSADAERELIVNWLASMASKDCERRDLWSWAALMVEAEIHREPGEITQTVQFAVKHMADRLNAA